MTLLSSTETTSQASTTTSEAGILVACPADPSQCLRTLKIDCDNIIFGLTKDSETTLDDCAHKCKRQANCVQFAYNGDNNYYYLSYDAGENEGNAWFSGWASGIKGTYEQ
jgi:predicted nucleic acid-binding Zn ribbon protein